MRFIAWAWVVLAAVFMARAGKPYYLAGLLPVLIAAGSVQADGWLGRGRTRVRRALLLFAVVSSGAVGLVIALPVLAQDDLAPVLALNEDAGETIGWPDLARTVAAVARGLPDGTVILTRNYGEAGALERYGPPLGLPPVFSGHNAYGDWGPPPADGMPVIAVGLPADELDAHLRGCRLAARIDNRAGVENEEQGRAVTLCAGPRRSWQAQWPALRHLG